MIIVAGPFMLVIIAMCVSLMKALRAEPYESTLPSRVRRAVLHAQEHDIAEHQTVALAVLGADAHETTRDRADGAAAPVDSSSPWTPRDPSTGGSSRGCEKMITGASNADSGQRLDNPVRREASRQVLDLLAAVAEQVVDGGEAGGEVADGVLRGHADAAVELDGLLADVAAGAC